jgi:hypothetical protein
MNLKKMILGANFTEIVIAKDLMIPNGNVNLLRWSGQMYRIIILEIHRNGSLVTKAILRNLVYPYVRYINLSISPK